MAQTKRKALVTETNHESTIQLTDGEQEWATGKNVDGSM